MASRPEVIERLVEDMIAVTRDTATVTQATNDEIISAAFTLLRRHMAAVLAISQRPSITREALKGTVFTVLADLADIDKAS